MPKFRLFISQTFHTPPFEVEADNEDEAKCKASDMFFSGEVGDGEPDSIVVSLE